MNYKETVEYIENLPLFTKKNPISHTKKCLELLGDIENKMKFIHVAGTNGKGSTCVFISEILKENGYKVGLFTSPHLIKINERFKINGIDISDEDFILINKEMEKLLNKLEKEKISLPSYFEYLFLMSVIYFHKNKVDYVVLETGLGGRLDATNSIENPVLSVLTPIDMDHTSILGNTIQEIAMEKSGIIKRGKSVVVAPQKKEALEAIKNICRNQGAKLYEIHKDDINITKYGKENLEFIFEKKKYEINFIPKYQAVNAAVAIKACSILNITHNIGKAIKKAKNMGRFQKIRDDFFIDGGHNIQGVQQLVETINSLDLDEIILIFAVAKDKDYGNMVKVLNTIKNLKTVIITKINSPRGLETDKIKDYFKTSNIIIIDDPIESLNYALNNKEKNQTLVVSGSLYLIGDVLQYIKNLNN